MHIIYVIRDVIHISISIIYLPVLYIHLEAFVLIFIYTFSMFALIYVHWLTVLCLYVFLWLCLSYTYYSMDGKLIYTFTLENTDVQ